MRLAVSHRLRPPVREYASGDSDDRQSLSSGRLQSILVSIVMLFGGGQVAWAAERIGGAEIVINIVQGDLGSGSVTPVAQGDAVYQDEGVRTRVYSKARFVLLDQRNVTIGPSSTIKFDRFAYNGSKQRGKIVRNLAKGTRRLIVGDADKRAYTIVTPTAAIGIRESEQSSNEYSDDCRDLTRSLQESADLSTMSKLANEDELPQCCLQYQTAAGTLWDYYA